MVIQRAVAAAESKSDKDHQSALVHNLGIVAKDQGDYGAARRYYEESLRIAREVGDKRTEGLILGILGHACTALKRYADAVAHLRAGISILKGINLPLGQCWLA